MAKRLAIIRPLPFTIVGSSNLTNAANLLTPDPKEAATYASGVSWSVDLDVGAAMSIDTAFLGYMLSAHPITVRFGTTVGGSELAGPLSPAHQATPLYDPVYHVPNILNAAGNARYIRLASSGASPAAGSFGVAAIGKSVQPSWGHEFGSGRPIEDTGISERLFGGGFGTYDGARVGGYQWTFGDLSDAEVQSLFAIAKDRGTTRSVLVIEDWDATDGLNERTHWGLFDRLETYERQVPGASRYAFKVRDWA